MHIHSHFLLGFVLALVWLGRVLAHPLDASNVVWTERSRDSSGSMPIGNGDLGLNVWVEPDGDLQFYVAKTDAWDSHARLLKLTKVRLRLTPNPFQTGLPFRQELLLREGRIEITAGEDAGAVRIKIWVDALRPVVRVELESALPREVEARIEPWRRNGRELSADEASGAETFGEKLPVVAHPDTVIQDHECCLVWYHRNPESVFNTTLEHQDLAELVGRFRDPLLNRTFGGALTSTDLARIDDTTLKSSQLLCSALISLHALTAVTTTPGEWMSRLEEQKIATERVPLIQAREAHERWWAAFWDRSWIRVLGTHDAGLAAAPITTNDLPLRVGADSEGANRFQGELGRVGVYRRALTPAEVASLATLKPAPTNRPPGCVWEWTFSRGPSDEQGRPLADAPMPQAVGKSALEEHAGGFAGRTIRFTGEGYYEVPDQPDLRLREAVTLEAWVRPGTLGAGGGRILDKSRAGTSDGYLLDTFPGHSLRLIVADGALSHDAQLPAGEWSHVAGVFDARTGEKKLYVNGRVAAEAGPGGAAEPVAQILNRGYALQRFLNACAGRGAFPIKFNGSIFTVDVPGKFDPDYRQWGGCYWFQNTRLPYWPMLASGDLDLLQPLFRMYLDGLPLACERTRLYYQHEGAFFPETMHFWGSYHNGGLGYGWEREGEPKGRTANRYIRYHWSGALELLTLMLDYHAFSGNDAFLRESLLPFAADILRFYERHYPRQPNGKILFAPAQALETWWECENPMPEVAGLHFVLERLLDLPASALGADRAAVWRRFRAELPPVPVREVDGARTLLPAESWRTRQNAENPELYAVFPFRLFGVGKPDLETAQTAFARRAVRGNRGWQQDDTQAAFLGQAQEAARMVSNRLATKHEGSRFPAFWGPNFDWIPDQDHGGNALMTLQTMLLQTEGQRLLLFPAWPRDWDVEFKLHAPMNTTVEGVWRQGKLDRLVVQPPERERDVVRLEPQ